MGGRRVAILLSLVAAAARADTFDLALHRLVTPPAMGQLADPAKDIEAQQAYRQIVSELGVALAPKFLTTADTVGYSGFQFTFDASFTSISQRVCDAGEGKHRCPYQYGLSGGIARPKIAPETDETVKNPVPRFASTLSLMARKGIWLPLPSFEIGAGATHLVGSSTFALQLYAKFALHEGFHDWPIPSLSVRGSVLRAVGIDQVDLTMAQVDSTVSKSFGLFGTVTLVPYLGWGALFIVAKGQVLDTTPDVDAYKLGPASTDLNANAVFPDQPTITRWRFFGGFRVNYSILVLTFDYTLSPCGDFTGNPSNECDHQGRLADQKVPDNSATQHTVSLSGGFLF